MNAFRHNVIIPLVHQFRIWVSLAGAVAGLVVAFLRAASGAGGSLAISLRSVIRHWTNWINSNPDKVRAFFDHAVRKAKEIVKGIRDIVHWLRVNLPRAADKAKEAFSAIGPVLQGLIDLLGEFNDLSGSGISKLLLPLSPRQSNQHLGGPLPNHRIPPTHPGGLQYDPPKTVNPRHGRAEAASVTENHYHITVPGGKSPDPRSLVESIRHLVAVKG